MNLLKDAVDDEVLDGPGEPETIRVVLADSQGIYGVGIRRILALEGDIRLLAQAGSVEELLATIERHPTDVVLIEGELLVRTPGSVPELQRISPNIKLIVQTASVNEDQTLELYRRGIRGIISRSISPDLLVRCIRCINSGETWIDNQALNWVISAYRIQDTAFRSPRPRTHLSLKETVIITCITQGLRNKEIAFRLGTTEQVVKNCLRKIYDKLGVTDRLGLAIHSLEKKIVQANADQVGMFNAARQKA